MRFLFKTGRFVQSVILSTVALALALVGGGYFLYKNGHDTIPFAILSNNDGTLTIQPISHSDPERDAAWKQAQREAVQMWNESSENINITITEDSPNTIRFSKLPGDAQAYYYPTLSCLVGECIFSIHIKEEYYTTFREYFIKYRGKYLIAHELGHALGLNDLQTAQETSIMNYQWRYVSRTPTELDVRRVEGRITFYQTLTGLPREGVQRLQDSLPLEHSHINGETHSHSPAND